MPRAQHAGLTDEVPPPRAAQCRNPRGAETEYIKGGEGMRGRKAQATGRIARGAKRGSVRA